MRKETVGRDCWLSLLVVVGGSRSVSSIITVGLTVGLTVWIKPTVGLTVWIKPTVGLMCE